VVVGCDVVVVVVLFANSHEWSVLVWGGDNCSSSAPKDRVNVRLGACLTKSLDAAPPTHCVFALSSTKGLERKSQRYEFYLGHCLIKPDVLAAREHLATVLFTFGGFQM